MIDIEHQRTIDLSADRVWQELRHFDRVLHWIPGGEHSSIAVSGEGIGAIRDIQLATQGYVQHRLVQFDDAQRTLGYELTAGKPIGMQDYNVAVSVVPINENSCRIQWAGRMSADATLNEDEVGQALETALANMTTGLIARLHGEKPRFEEQPNEDWQLRNESHAKATT